MLHSQPELGYDIRGIIGEPRDRPDWVDLPCSPRSTSASVANQVGANGVLVVANAARPTDE